MSSFLKNCFSISIIKHYRFSETFRNTKPLCGKRPSSKIILISNWLNTRLIHCFNKIASARAQLIAGIFIFAANYYSVFHSKHHVPDYVQSITLYSECNVRVADRKPHSHNSAQFSFNSTAHSLNPVDFNFVVHWLQMHAFAYYFISNHGCVRACVCALCVCALCVCSVCRLVNGPSHLEAPCE